MDLGMHGGEQMTYRFMVRRANHSDARTRAGLVALAG